MLRDLFQFIPVLTVWASVKTFALSLSSQKGHQGNVQNNIMLLRDLQAIQVQAKAYKKGNPTWPQIRKQYEGLKELADLINELDGGFLVCTLVNMIMYFAVAFYKTVDWISTTIAIIYFVGFAIDLYFAADICHQVSINMGWFF